MNIDQLLEQLDFSHCYTTDRRHCRQLYTYVLAYKCKEIVEIGSFKGISTACLTLAAKETGGLVYAVDPCTECDEQERNRYWANLGVAREIVPQCFTCVDYLNILRGGIEDGDMARPDFIFHDGIHGEQAVPEYIQCWDILASGGVFAAHDLDQVDLAKLEKCLSPCSLRVYDTDSKGRTIGFMVKG